MLFVSLSDMTRSSFPYSSLWLKALDRTSIARDLTQREGWQMEWSLNGIKDTGQSGVPGNKCCDDTEPTADDIPGSATTQIADG